MPAKQGRSTAIAQRVKTSPGRRIEVNSTFARGSYATLRTRTTVMLGECELVAVGIQLIRTEPGQVSGTPSRRHFPGRQMEAEVRTIKRATEALPVRDVEIGRSRQLA